MNPKYVVSLEVAKRMVDAGWKKKTEFYHILIKIPYEEKSIWAIYPLEEQDFDNEKYSAPLSDEILDELPECFESSLGISTFIIEKVGISYLAGYRLLIPNKMPLFKQADTLPNALGELWIIMQKMKEVATADDNHTKRIRND